MKKLLCSVLATIFLITAVWAQQDNTASPSRRFPTIPPFTLIALDSSHLTRANLSGNKKTMIMYFSPDCEHCQHQTEEMLKNIDRFKGVQIVMATYQPFEEMTGFNKKYNLANYPQIKIGRDAMFFFVPYYKISVLPYVALYDAKGNLLKTFEGTTDIGKIANAFEKNSKKTR